MNKHGHILQLIKLIRGSSAEELLGKFYKDTDRNHCSSVIIKEIFTNGNCGQLVKILKHVYPETKAVIIEGLTDPETSQFYSMFHIVADIDGKLYDIDGEFMNSDLRNYKYEYMSEEDFNKEQMEYYSFEKRGPMEYK